MDNTLTKKRAYETVFRRFYQPVCRFVGALIHSEGDVEDIVQEVFAALWLKPELWQDTEGEEGRQRLRNTVYKIAKNITLNHLRHLLVERRYEQQATRDVYDELTAEELAVEPIYYEEAALLLRLRVAQFPERRREIFEIITVR